MEIMFLIIYPNIRFSKDYLKFYLYKFKELIIIKLLIKLKRIIHNSDSVQKLIYQYFWMKRKSKNLVIRFINKQKTLTG